MPEILKLYKNIAYFKQQGVEKKLLEAAGCERVKKFVTCFNCQGQDRTINKRQPLQKRSGAFRIENRFLLNFAQESTLV